MTKKTVLVVEDDASLLENLVQIFELGKFPVAGAKNGQEALDYLRQAQELPGLICLDLMMPVMDGQDFLIHTQTKEENARFKEIPVLIVSAARTEIAGQTVGRLMKPPSFDELLRFAEKYCGSETAKSASAVEAHGAGDGDPMVNKNDKKGARTVRSKTDKSLVVERGKTDSLLKESTKRIEDSFDESVQKSRQRFDSEIERKRQSDPEGGLATGRDDSVLKNSQSDSILANERKNEDELLRKERVQKKLVAEALLSAERKLTDADLLAERVSIDKEMGHQANLHAIEEALHQAAVAALVSRNRFLAMVSHDLRNPLSAIAMSSGLISRSIKKSEANMADILKWSDSIERNASNMDRLISDLLDVEKISHGKLKLAVQRHNADQLLRECETLFSSVASARSIKFKVSDIGDVVFVNCDFDRILQVFSNLIGNAFKFTPEGGTIEVVAKVNEVDVEFSVIDSGPGVPEEARHLIFKQFSQIRTNDQHGLGLGLFISKWIVEEHGGRIWVSSEIGKGSTFYFTLRKEQAKHG